MRVSALWLAGVCLLWACGTQPQTQSSASGSPTPAAQTLPESFRRNPQTGLAALPVLGSTPIALEAQWEPLEGPELLDHPDYQFFSKLKPAEPTHSYPSNRFLIFLPPKAVQLGAPFPVPSDAVPVGSTWGVPANAAAHFLKQFHPSATADLVIDAPGAYATLRARSKDRWEIVFRIHAQFQMIDGIFMTPGQFEGRLLVNLAENTVEYAEFAVPNERPANVAIDSIVGDGLAGVARLPRMQLVGGDRTAIDSVAWLEEISQDKARRLLRERFYAFEAIEWSPLKVALARASIEHKPLFAIVIAGPLDDQAC